MLTAFSAFTSLFTSKNIPVYFYVFIAFVIISLSSLIYLKFQIYGLEKTNSAQLNIITQKESDIKTLRVNVATALSANSENEKTIQKLNTTVKDLMAHSVHIDKIQTDAQKDIQALLTKCTSRLNELTKERTSLITNKLCKCDGNIVERQDDISTILNDIGNLK